MYFIQRRHSPYHLSQQLLQPNFAYLLANPEETLKQTCARRCKATRTTASNNSNKTYMHVVDETDRFTLYTDLPGVKKEDLKVELTEKFVLRVHGQRKNKNGETFDRQFLVDDELVDITKITATLMDGTLEIVTPKKPTPELRCVKVFSGIPSSPTEDSWKTIDVDVPGVKLDALQIQVNDNSGKVTILGERKRGRQTMKLQRTFSLNRRVVDTNKVEAFLEDGVLILRAPFMEPFAGRVIPVNADKEEEYKTAAALTGVEEDEGESGKEDTSSDVGEIPSLSPSPAFETIVAEENNGEAMEEEKEESPKDDEQVAEPEMEFEVVPETVQEGED